MQRSQQKHEVQARIIEDVQVESHTNEKRVRAKIGCAINWEARDGEIDPQLPSMYPGVALVVGITIVKCQWSEGPYLLIDSIPSRAYTFRVDEPISKRNRENIIATEVFAGVGGGRSRVKRMAGMMYVKSLTLM